MAGYMCDSQDGTAAHFVVSNTTNGEVTALCAPCYADFVWQMVQELPDYEARMKLLLVGFLEKQEAAASRGEKRARRVKMTTEAQGEDTTADAVAADTPDQVEDK